MIITLIEKQLKLPRNSLKAIARQESGFRNVIGDKHLENQAYGWFQLRTPAIEEVNHIYKIDLASNAEDVKDNFYLQTVYAGAYLKYLLSKDQGLEWAFGAYNMGPSPAMKPKLYKKNPYHKKVYDYYLEYNKD